MEVEDMGATLDSCPLSLMELKKKLANAAGIEMWPVSTALCPFTASYTGDFPCTGCSSSLLQAAVGI